LDYKKSLIYQGYVFLVIAVECCYLINKLEIFQKCLVWRSKFGDNLEVILERIKVSYGANCAACYGGNGSDRPPGINAYRREVWMRSERGNRQATGVALGGMQEQAT
jgi:hypothetical protein